MPLGSIGDQVWFDWDGDAVQDSDETSGPNDVLVWLYRDNGDGVFDADTDTLSQTTTTSNDDTGHYLFTGVTPGKYWVLANQYDPDFPTLMIYLTSNANPHGMIDLQPGQNYRDADIGFVYGGV
ncbi:hypothetical protein F8S13_24785 [Chloroflexia bacterium SDU3-3]|nr:hypothetical protein F8S13_24785 [Chloroflexia bacterium SDU3-3]